MSYRTDDIGPALRRLRKAHGLSQEQVAAELGISRTGPSRYEKPGTNMQLSSLLAYLQAIDATFEDLHRELHGGVDAEPDELSEALDEQIRLVEERIQNRSGHRRLALSLMERFGGPELPQELRVMAELIDDQDQRLREQDERLRRLEAEREEDDDDPPVDGSSGGSAES